MKKFILAFFGMSFLFQPLYSLANDSADDTSEFYEKLNEIKSIAYDIKKLPSPKNMMQVSQRAKAIQSSYENIVLILKDLTRFLDERLNWARNEYVKNSLELLESNLDDEERLISAGNEYSLSNYFGKLQSEKKRLLVELIECSKHLKWSFAFVRDLILLYSDSVTIGNGDLPGSTDTCYGREIAAWRILADWTHDQELAQLLQTCYDGFDSIQQEVLETARNIQETNAITALSKAYPDHLTSILDIEEQASLVAPALEYLLKRCHDRKFGFGDYANAAQSDCVSDLLSVPRVQTVLKTHESYLLKRLDSERVSEPPHDHQIGSMLSNLIATRQLLTEMELMQASSGNKYWYFAGGLASIFTKGLSMLIGGVKRAFKPNTQNVRGADADPARIDFGIPPAPAFIPFQGPGSFVQVDVVRIEPEAQGHLESERKRERERLEHEQVARIKLELERDRIACWARSGHPFQKGGAQDHSFYDSIKTDLENKNGRTREDIIEERWPEFKMRRDERAKSKKTKKAPRQAVTKAERKEKEPAPAVAPKTKPARKAAPIVLPSMNDNNIDWSVPLVSENDKKDKESKKKAQVHKTNALLCSAYNECLNIASVLAWHRGIDKFEEIHNDILADNLWYSDLLALNAVAENDALRRTQIHFGEDFNGDRDSLLTADDGNARVLRNRLLHYFPPHGMVLDHCRNVMPLLCARLREHCVANAVDKRAFLVDLSKHELFQVERQPIDVNEVIREQFARIKRYYDYLNRKEMKMKKAFAALARQNDGEVFFDAGVLDYRFVDVFAARAIEACLVRLGKLFSVYMSLSPTERELPESWVRLMRELNEKVRKKVAHQIDIDNTEWHYSPISAGLVERMMLKALGLYQNAPNDNNEPEQEEPRPKYNVDAPVFKPGSKNQE